MTDDLEKGGLSGAMAARATAADWLIARRMSETWSEADQAELEHWLAQSPANRIAYWRLDGAWGQAQRLAALKQPMRRAQVPSGRRGGLSTYRFAAVLGVAMLGLAAIMGGLKSQFADGSDLRTYTTPVGGRLTVSLGDGSKIELNTDSTLQVSGNADRRSATLERGEAFFQIKHDPSRPFVVSVGQQRIVDLGTKFAIRKTEAAVRVSLFEGSAKVENVGRSADHSKILQPGDVAVATANAIRISKSPLDSLREDLAWRRGMIEFARATLAEAATEFNRYNRTKVVIADPNIARLTIHGTFPAQDVLAFADAAQAYFHLHAEKRNGAIVISR